MTENRFNEAIIRDNITRIKDQVAEAAISAGRNPAEIRLMAVTKTVPAYAVNMAICNGIDLLGENRAQELRDKYDDYIKDNASIHFIGSLQTNKVRQIINKVDMIHCVDSLKLAAEIDRQARANGKVCDILLEVNVGGEASKSGIPPDGCTDFALEISGFSALRLRGLMTIPPFCDKMEETERYFMQMRELFVDIQAKNRDNRNVDILSMGMSGDFPAAVRHGATIIRLGTAIFGQR